MKSLNMLNIRKEDENLKNEYVMIKKKKKKKKIVTVPCCTLR
jgi:hypothetical protein